MHDWDKPKYLAAPPLYVLPSVLAFSPLKYCSSIPVILVFDAMAFKLARSKHQNFGLTHFLCFPITTQHSRPQLEKSLHHFRTDPSTSKIPPGAFRPLETLHISIRPLSLPTADRVQAACHHLRSLDVDGLLQRISTRASGNTQAVHEVQKGLPSIHQASSAQALSTESRLPPLAVSLSGVRIIPLRRTQTYPDRGTMNHSLHTLYSDSTSRLRPYIDEIRQSFDVTGFQIAGLRQHSSDRIVIVDTMHASNRPKTFTRDPNQPSKFRRALPSLFETENITRKFESFVFAENMRLEKLSLCRLGVLKEIEKLGAEAQLQEVCSVSLP